jgi:hypothetical protein
LQIKGNIMAKGKRVVPLSTPDLEQDLTLSLLAEAIKAKRTQLGMDEETSALLCAISKGTLRRIESGDPGTGIGKYLIVARGLGIKLKIMPWNV